MIHRSGGQALDLPALEGLVNVAGALPFPACLDHGVHQLFAVGRAEDHVRADRLHRVRLDLGVAAAHSQHRAGVFVAQAADGLAGFAPAFGGDGAGVDDHGVGDLPRHRTLKAALIEKTLHGLGLILVDLAAESGYNILHAVLRFCMYCVRLLASPSRACGDMGEVSRSDGEGPTVCAWEEGRPSQSPVLRHWCQLPHRGSQDASC